MRAAYGRTLKFTLIGVGLFALSLGASLALTDREPATLPLRARRWLASRPWRSSSAPPAAPSTVSSEPIPPFSDITFDDSGYATAHPLLEADRRPGVAGSRSGTRSSGRGRRGIAYLEAKLAALPPGDPATPVDDGRTSSLLIASLLMYEGDGPRRAQHFALAQTADPARPALFRANMDALRGVAALRRGEVENCVACCNESSCIFPLAAAAVHRRTAGSREAIEHFTRYLQTAAGRPGSPVALERRLHDPGRVPGGRSRRVPPAAGPVRRGGRRPAPDGQRGVQGRAQRAGRVDGRRVPGRRLRRRRPAGRLHAHDRPRARGTASCATAATARFEDVSDAAGLADQVLSLNACHADFDNDGALDILMLRGAWEVPRRMSLLRNRGGGLRGRHPGRRPRRADRHPGGRLGRLRQRRPCRPVRRRRVRPQTPRPAQPGPALPQPRRRHLRGRRRRGPA